jgi:hypothetical protein
MLVIAPENQSQKVVVGDVCPQGPTTQIRRRATLAALAFAPYK